VGYLERRSRKPERACRLGSVQRRRDADVPRSHDGAEGKHVVSLFTQWCPAGYADEPHPHELEAYANRVIDGYDELAPDSRTRSSTCR
jgi:hypothetical protein